jgi:hypothetical protein
LICIAHEVAKMSARVDGLSPSPFGVNSHQTVELLERLASIGIQWFRFDVNWDEIEREQGRPRWNDVEALVEEAARLRISLLASIAYTPAWARSDRNGTRASPPRDVDAFASFVTQFATQYRGRVACASIWNEPDLEQFWKGSQDQYLAVLQAGLRALRMGAPEMVRCGPDLAKWSDKNGDFLARILAATDADPGGPLLDVITHHQYESDNSVPGRVKKIESLRSLLARKDPHRRPLWITETGLDTGKGTPAAIGRYLQDLMRAMLDRSAWWKKTFWYDSHGTVADNPRERWGLLGPQGASDYGRPMPAFDAYQATIAASGFGGTRPTEPPADARQARALLEGAYRGILGRAPDAEGERGYLDEMRRGAVERVCAALFASAEFRGLGLGAEALVRQLYNGILGREPDEGGRATTLAAVQAGRAAQRAAEMLRSDEFRGRGSAAARRPSRAQAATRTAFRKVAAKRRPAAKKKAPKKKEPAKKKAAAKKKAPKKKARARVRKAGR